MSEGKKMFAAAIHSPMEQIIIWLRKPTREGLEKQKAFKKKGSSPFVRDY